MSDSSREIADSSAFRSRSLVKQVLFSIVTLGIYCLYWWYVTNQQLEEGTDASFSVALRTVGLFIPIYNLVVMWQTSQDAEAVVDQDGVLLFVLLIVFAPAAWYLIQSGINQVASGQTA